MQKTFKNQQGREILFIEIPLDSDTHYLAKINGQDVIVFNYDDKRIRTENIPQGNYQILCLAKDIDADKLLELGLAEKIGLSWNLETIYSKVPNTDFEKAVTTSPKESLTSLLISLGFKQDDNVIILEKI